MGGSPNPAPFATQLTEFAEPHTHPVFSRLSSSPGVFVDEKKEKVTRDRIGMLRALGVLCGQMVDVGVSVVIPGLAVDPWSVPARPG